MDERLHRLPRRPARLKRLFVPLVFLLIECGCGGGGGGENTVSQPPTPDFTLSASPPGSSLNPGNSLPIMVSATAINGFSSQISVQATNLPTGVTASPLSFNLTVGTPQSVLLSVATNAQTGSGETVLFTGTSGSLSHNAPFALNINVALSNTPPTRTRYVRTDSVSYTELVYNPNTNQFFSVDPVGGQVAVLDANTETKVGSITVPGANGIDDTPDHKTLYVGTTIGDVYVIDTASLTVTNRYIGSQIGPYGYPAYSVGVLADGRLALLGEPGGLPSIDGSPGFAIWSPTDNSITIYGGAPYGVPTVPDCVGNISGFSRTADRTKVILGSIDSDSTLCEVDESTGQENYVAAVSEFSTDTIVTSPDGNYIALPHNGSSQAGAPPLQVDLYDAQTLVLIAQFSISGDDASLTNFVFSADSKTLFASSATIIYAYNIAAKKLVGWAPNIEIGPIYQAPFYQAVDGTGLFAGPTEEGVVFFDSTSMQTGPVGSQFFANPNPIPATGPVTGGTQVQVTSLPTTDTNPLVYFGSQKGSYVSRAETLATVTTPPGAAGPADVYSYASDGGADIFPEGFSYGPTILEVTPNASTADGGGTGVVFGYGFGSTSATSVPSDLQVSVNNKPALVSGFAPNAYGIFDPPFPLEAVQYVIPPGIEGPASVTVGSSSGDSTAPAALTYLPAIQQFQLPGSSLVQGIYDPYLDLYYFTDANKVQVFSKSKGQWLTPISIPAPPGATQRLWGIALSPDGSKLAVSDASAGVIYFLNLANPSAVSTFSAFVPNTIGLVEEPVGLAVSNSGVVYFATVALGGPGSDSSYYNLDTNSGAITDYHISGPDQLIDGVPQDYLLKAAISSDNSRVFFNNDGGVFSIDTSSGEVFHAPNGPGCCVGDYDLTLSNSQTRLAATSYLFDSDLNAESFLTLNDREIDYTSYVYGAKLSPDSSFLFQPSINGIDVFDGRLGTLLTRVALPVTLSTNYDALVADGGDNVLVAITGETGTGIAIVDLTSLSEPSPLPYASEVLARSNQLTGPNVGLSRGPVSGSRLTNRPSSPTLRPHFIQHVTGPVLKMLR